jgi:SecD/SecF fusion protein
MKPQQLTQLLFAIAALAIAAIVTAIFIPPKYGLDIQGGARVVLEADTSKMPAGRPWNQDTRNAVIHTLDNRVNSSGVAEPVLSTKGEKQFVVELPSVRNEKEILEQLQNTAQLQFYYSPDWRTNRNQLGRYSIERSDPGGARELYHIVDRQSNKTFRDLFQINQDLRQIFENGAKAGDKAVETPLPPAIADLSAAGGLKSARIASEDAPKIAALAEEAANFNSFIAGARLELTGSDILPKTKSGFASNGTSGAIVDVEFTSEGGRKFGSFTRDHSQEILMIYLDGRILSAPNINEPILSGKAQISGFATLKEAKQTADLLNGGALPVPLKIVQQQSVEPTLGRESVQRSVIAGAVGIGAVALFMWLYYATPGLVAVVALALYTLFTYAIFVLIPVTFTLPGIAGFILSAGMAVDANILIFERTKEELRAGKPARQAIEAGFQRAFSAILDSNVCTAVTSLFLYYLGTGAVRGFALTLLIGVAISMFTAITVTRTILVLLVNSGKVNTAAAWHTDRQFRPNIDVVHTRAMWYGISIATIIIGMVFAGMGGFKRGIDFTGGSELTLRFTQPVTREAVEKAVAAQGVTDPAAQIAGGNTVFVRLPQQAGVGEVNAAKANAIVQGLQTQFPGVKREGFESIGSSISSELTRNALWSILLSSLFILLYLALRFAQGGFVDGLKYGVAAIIAMLHDVLVLGGVFCILGYFLNWKVDSLFVTAALTVIGFSVHDTIVIFDRIRENLKLHGRRQSFGEVINNSVNETFARSVFTSMTVVLTLLALLIFGGEVIRPLNAALLVGILSGTYSSIFNAAPLVLDLSRWFGGKSSAPETSRASVRSTSTPERVQGTAPQRPASPSSPATTPVTPRPSAPVFPTISTPGAGNGATTDGASKNGAAASSTPRPRPGTPRPRRRRM